MPGQAPKTSRPAKTGDNEGGIKKAAQQVAEARMRQENACADDMSKHRGERVLGS